MKDTELRGLILRKYYDLRGEDLFQWTDEHFKDLPQPWGFDAKDLFRICDQLAEEKLIEWHPALDNMGRTIGGLGKISAYGVDVIEGEKAPPISITFDHSQHVSVLNSTGVQIGDSNVQGVSIDKIIIAIDRSNAVEAQKEEAKSLLKKFLEHPLVVSIASGLASTIKKP
jgi:hypothetical protein